MMPRYARLLALVALGMLVASGPAFAQTTVDYDTDNDNYIEVSGHAQLNAIRWDLNGDGVVAATDTANYNAAFPNAATGMGCLTTCVGYELTANIDLDTDGDGTIGTDSGDAYYNSGAGWLPIGGTYTGNFKGNSHTIDNLFINRSSTNNIGLFSQFGSGSRVETLGIINANVTLRARGGILVYYNSGTIVACYTTGTITGEEKISGLVGQFPTGSISTSYSHASVTSTTNDSDIGGLVGYIWGDAILKNSYFAGTLNTGGSPGGIVGDEDGGSVSNSYWDSSKARGTIQKGSGQSTSNLQGPTGYTGIYANWNLNLDGNTASGDSQGRDDPWNFGTSSQYPVLKYVSPSVVRIDYDDDNDGLIDITTLAQLNAIRHDLNGNGDATHADYGAAFPGRNTTSSGRMGCPSGTCTGYELLNNLDFDENNDGAITQADTTYWNSGQGWMPIGSDASPALRYTGNFKGNGYTVQNLFISRSTVSYQALFGGTGTNSRIESLGVTDADVTADDFSAILVGGNRGEIVACYTTGRMTGDNVVGGLVGWTGGSISTSYSLASVSATERLGGLVGSKAAAGSITNSYSTGVVSLSSGSMTSIGGLLGEAVSGTGTVSGSYWDTQTSGRTTSFGGSGAAGKTTSDLQSPTTYGATTNDTYYNWNTNIDGQAGNDDPWTFGTMDQYPVLKYAGMDTTAQYAAQPRNYDTDSDGLIDITTLAQLNAIRHDLNGNGDATHADYGAAFPGRNTTSSGRMGCPSGTCTGYELLNNLNFDENNDGAITQADTTYWNSGQGWMPIGSDASPALRYTGNFKGNGYTVQNLFISRSTVSYQALFGGTGTNSRIESLGVTDADVTADDFSAILVGGNRGEIVACYTTGRMTGDNVVGGLVGWTGGSISTSYSLASVSATERLGGLVGSKAAAGSITNSYSTGAVSLSSGSMTSIGGLLGESNAGTGTVSGSYWDTQTSGRTTSLGGSGVVGKTASELQSPTTYGATSNDTYYNWNANIDGQSGNDDPWTFGTMDQYPVLKYAGMDTTAQYVAQPVNYDTDSDGLIEVSSLAQLHAMRWDINGDGAIDSSATTADTTAYNAAFPNGNLSASKGCPSSGCTGYELLNNLDFDENNDGAITSADATYWNSGQGWMPIGSDANPALRYTGDFKGNGYTVQNLFISRSAVSYQALFGGTGTNSRIESLGVTDADVTADDFSAILAGANRGEIVACYTTGRMTGDNVVGGLVGWTGGSISTSYSLASVSATERLGGLVGSKAAAGSITNSYSTGAVSLSSGSMTSIGGLLGESNAGTGTVSGSYWDTQTSGRTTSLGGSGVVGKTASELQSPTTYGATTNDTYYGWNANLDGQPGNDDPWTFGTMDQYPALKYAGLDTTVQFQLQPAVVTLALTPSSISESGGMSTVTATLSRSKNTATTITVRPVADAYTVGADSTITIAAGSTANASDTVVITAVNNTQDAPNRDVTMSAVMHNSQVSGRVTGTLTITDDDLAPMVTLTPNPASISENGEAATVTASLSRPSSAATTITVRSVTGAYAVISADTTITIAAGDTINASDTVVITTLDNTRDELARTVTLSGVSRNAQGAGSVTGTVTLTDDDAPPTVTMVVAPASITENVGVSTVTARLSHTSSHPTTITVTVAPVSPAVPADYMLSTPPTLTVAAGQTTSAGTVTITGEDNADATGNKTVTVSSTLTNSVGTGSVTDVTLTLTDDDVPNVTLVLTPASITENAQVSTITATLDRITNMATTVTVSATAVAPAVAGDFTLSTATTLTFAANVTTSTGTVTITSVNDTTDAPDKRVTVSATVAGGNGASLSSAVTLTITDDEAAPDVALTLSPASIAETGGVSTITATLSHASSAATTITVRPVAGAYTVGSDSTITIAAGNTANASDTVEITAVDNATDAPNNDVTVSVVANNDQGAGSVTGMDLTITDDDAAPNVTLMLSPASISENGGVSTVSATLTHPSSAATTITVRPVANAYTVGSDSTITIAAGNTANASDTVALTAVDNDIDASDNAVMVQTAAVENDHGAGTVQAATLTITDDDEAAIDVSAMTTTTVRLHTTESGRAETFTVTLASEPTGNVALSVVSSDTTEGTVSPSVLTFSSTTWRTAQTVTVTGQDDTPAAVDGNQNYTVTLSVNQTDTQDTNYDALTAISVYMVNRDNDFGLDISALTGQATEAGASATFTVALLTQPTAAVTISVTSQDPSEGRVEPAMLTFTTSGYNTAQTVTVTGQDDIIDDGNVTWTVRLASSSGDANYNTLSDEDVPVTTTDDEDAPTVTLVLMPSSISENGEVSTITATLSHPSSAITTITVSATPVSPATASDFTLSSADTLIIAATTTTSTGTVTITAEDNNDQADEKMVRVSATANNAQGITDPSPVTLTLTDDETPSANLDVDGDGRVRLFSDIILVIRYVLFFREEALLRGNVIEPTATRKTAQEIEPYLDTLVNQNILDVDGDGDVRLFSDIILIIRYVLFFRNEALIRGNVIEPTATRTTAQEIEPYIRSLYPDSHFQ